MKYQYIFLLSFLCLSTFLVDSKRSDRYFSSETISKEILKKEIIARMERVDELRAMKELAQELGIKQVYLFGGSAAAWAHYVYWDLEREAGMGNYDESRFDYDYTSIFRANQDMDIVIDVNEENEHLVKEFEQILQERFKHFQGSKSAWEVRPLRFQFGDKDKILDNPDFMGQNSDSHSTGLISVTNNDSVGIRDFKDWENADNHFFDDVYKRELHYYRDQVKHSGTKRFKSMMNPEIFSAIRYLTKAFQYELEIDDESLVQISEVISQFDPNGGFANNYTANWIEKNAKKLYQNAIDLEFAYNVMNKLGLQEKLMAIKKDQGVEESLAWWMNKMPLLTSPLGDPKKGKTAQELGIDIVAHETKSFAAYESITKSHSGLANVFISRDQDDIIGEMAAHGDGFYARVGRIGARNTGLTIRFKLHPQAVQGIDFKLIQDYVVIKNKAAIQVVPESLELSLYDFFQKLSQGELIFDHSDRGVREKLKRKFKSLAPGEKEKIIALVKADIKNFGNNGGFSSLLIEWFSSPFSKDYPEFIVKLDELGVSTLSLVKYVFNNEHWTDNNEVVDILEKRLPRANEKELEYFIEEVLSNKFWAESERGAGLLEILIRRDNWEIHSEITHLFRKEYWAKNERGGELFIEFYKNLQRSVESSFVEWTLSQKFWWKREEGIKVIDMLIEKNTTPFGISKHIFADQFWTEHEKGVELILKFINGDHYGSELGSDGRNAEFVINDILTKEHWAKHERGIEIFEAAMEKMKKQSISYQFNKYIKGNPLWTENPILLRKLKGKELTLENVQAYLKKERASCSTSLQNIM